MQEENKQVEDVEAEDNEIQENPKYKLIKIPKQNFRTNRLEVKPVLDNKIVKDLKEVFDLFSTTDKVNPHNIKEGVRTVSKKNKLNKSINFYFLLDFHKECPQIYKFIEELCLQFDVNGTPVNFDQFINFITDRLGETTSRNGIQKVFNNMMDPKEKEITPESLHHILNELGDKLTLEEVRYMLGKISEPSLDINISSDEFYYIMTKRPIDVDLITPVAKSTK